MSCCQNNNQAEKQASSCCGGGGDASPVLNQAQLEQVLGQLQGWHFDAAEDYLMAVIR